MCGFGGRGWLERRLKLTYDFRGGEVCRVEDAGAPIRVYSAPTPAEREELRTQMQAAEVVVALASLHGTHRDLLVFQLHFAKAGNKSVILLPGFGSEQVIPRAVTDLADVQVGWDERALVDAIRLQARHEETTRWDTIEFKID